MEIKIKSKTGNFVAIVDDEDLEKVSQYQEDMRTKLQRYQQTLIARYYNNDLTEKEKIDLNKIIDELSDLLK